MTATILTEKAYRAAFEVAKPKRENGSRGWRKESSLPILNCILIRFYNGRGYFSTHNLEEPITEEVPARVDSEFSACVPMRAFTDWLKVTQTITAAIRLDLDPATQILTVTGAQVGDRFRAEFKCIDAQEFPPV